ncbi:MAG TPA: YCF48-related protein, partial [Ferruginibacter sp.]|nr:YCF48-related protein [Ferruginibacter sp.]
MKRFLMISFFVGSAAVSTAQTVTVITSGIKSSMRGLSVVNDDVLWVSGSGGTVGRSTDAGKTWRWTKIAGLEKTEFRDIEAFDSNTAIIMGIEKPAVILKTTDGGNNWSRVFESDREGMFLDAMEFWNEQSGIVIGDPIKGKFFVARTFDGGNKWIEIPDDRKPVADSGEACFASSGTNIRALTKSEAIFISGGLHSNVFVRDTKLSLPMLQGKESTGANSIAIRNKKNWMIVGGDFYTKDSSTGNCAITTDGGKSFVKPIVPPHGYRSCVEYI